MPEQNSSRIALFIDGANIYATAKAIGFDIDYKRLLKEFQSRGTLVRAYYYTAIVEDQEYLSIRPLIDWLDYNSYTVVTRATKEFADASGRRKAKGNIDIELAVHALEIAGHVDQIVLFSGNGDFRSLVEAVQRRGARVTVVSTISSQPPMIADDLRRQADVFIDLMELRSRIGRDPSERPLSRDTTERWRSGSHRLTSLRLARIPLAGSKQTGMPRSKEFLLEQIARAKRFARAMNTDADRERFEKMAADYQSAAERQSETANSNAAYPTASAEGDQGSTTD